MLSSCSPALFNNFRNDTGNTGNDPSWFRDNGESLLCNASIKAWSSEFTGIMIIKSFSGNYRCLFMTETGIKIFDLEVSRNGSHRMHYCIEQLNRKSVIRLLAEDFGLMIYPVSNEGKIKLMKEGKDGPVVIKTKDPRGTSFIRLNENEKVASLVHAGTFFKKLEIRFLGSSMAPKQISIRHVFLKIAINLRTIDDISR